MLYSIVKSCLGAVTQDVAHSNKATPSTVQVRGHK